MKYSLRSLMIGITLFCVVLGSVMGRVEYLRRWAAFHGREEGELASRLKESSEPMLGVDGTLTAKDGTSLADIVRMSAELNYHQKMQRRYSTAVYRPWTLVHDDRPKWMAP